MVLRQFDKKGRLFAKIKEMSVMWCNTFTLSKVREKLRFVYEDIKFNSIKWNYETIGERIRDL